MQILVHRPHKFYNIVIYLSSVSADYLVAYGLLHNLRLIALAQVVLYSDLADLVVISLLFLREQPKFKLVHTELSLFCR